MTSSPVSSQCVQTSWTFEAAVYNSKRVKENEKTNLMDKFSSSSRKLKTRANKPQTSVTTLSCVWCQALLF